LSLTSLLRLRGGSGRKVSDTPWLEAIPEAAVVERPIDQICRARAGALERQLEQLRPDDTLDGERLPRAESEAS
jgi:hypothetical protein